MFDGTQTGRISGKNSWEANAAKEIHGNVTQIDRKRTAEKIRHVAKKGSIWG